MAYSLAAQAHPHPNKSFTMCGIASNMAFVKARGGDQDLNGWLTLEQLIWCMVEDGVTSRLTFDRRFKVDVIDEVVIPPASSS